MTTITLSSLQAEHEKLGRLIEQFKEQQAATAPAELIVPGITIQLAHGEHYAGAVLDEAGRVKHHVVLMADRLDQRLDWEDAKSWAKDLTGGRLPTRQEQSLIFANCAPHLEAEWHWSCEPQGAPGAWGCSFADGSQSCGGRSFEGYAVAVRRVLPLAAGSAE